jgi:hypothetical protein
MLNLARIVAVHGMDANGCNRCLEVQNAKGGPSVYVWATDKKEAPGLDISRESFQLVTPGANVLDPQVCRWKVVDNEKCGRICFGSSEECTTGSRNVLPASLLPNLPPAPFGITNPSTNAKNSPARSVTPSTTKVTPNTTKHTIHSFTEISTTSKSRFSTTTFLSLRTTVDQHAEKTTKHGTTATTTISSSTIASLPSPSSDPTVVAAVYGVDPSSANTIKPLLSFILAYLLQ